MENPKAHPSVLSIAVLPFVNMSSSVENEYFSDGMTEEIINALAKIQQLKVTSRTSSFFFKNKNISISKIGEELNVSTVLEGSVRLSGNMMRITAQLIDVADDFHFWSETFDRSLDNIFSVQDEISLLIADKLREHLGHFDIEDHLVDVPDLEVEIYKKYLKGKYHFLKLSQSNIEKSIILFKSVIKAQPNFALAYLNINMAYAALGSLGLIPASDAFAIGKPFLDKGIELDENLPESQINLALTCCYQYWDFEGAYLHLNKALEVRPTADVYLNISIMLAAEGKFKAASNYLDDALQLDPLSHINHHMKGCLLYYQEKYEQAISCFEKSVRLEPNFVYSKLYWGQNLLLMGKTKAGLVHFQNFPPDELGDLSKLGGTTLAYAALGDFIKAEEGIAKLETALQTDSMGSAMSFLILCKTMMGRYDDAIQLIKQGVAYKLPMMLLLSTEPIVKVLRSKPRFQVLMQQIFGEKTSVHLSNRKYKKSLFDKALLEQYKQQLEDLMSEESPYLDPSLTLRSLAQILVLPPNHLSRLLNEGFDKNFAEYINSYRVETFKSKVTDSTQQHLTILALAYDSGFNSKTVFNTFFKKMTGMTPRAYWKDVVG